MSTRLKLKNVDSAKAQQHPFHIVDSMPLHLFMATAIVLLLLHIAFLSHNDYPIYDEGIFLTKLLEVLLTLVLMSVLLCSWHKVYASMLILVERRKISAILTLNAAMMQPGGGNGGNSNPNGNIFEQGVKVAANATGQNPNDIKHVIGIAAALSVIYAGVRLAKGIYYLITYDPSLEDENEPGMPEDVLDQQERDTAAAKYRADKEKRYKDPLRGPGEKYRDEHWKDDSDDDIGSSSEDD